MGQRDEMQITGIDALEVLDSRGNPTVRVFLQAGHGGAGGGARHGVRVSATVPSGASTGEYEAVELRDGDRKRYGGRGVQEAVSHVRGELRNALVGVDVRDQRRIDRMMIELDGTANKERLGANAILGVSMAVAKAGAVMSNLPLYAYLGGVGATRMPVPCMNILNGGVHADNSVDFQEFMIVPVGAACYSEGLRWNVEVFHVLKSILKERGLATSVGDEGGFAPNLKSNEEALELIVEAIEKAGYKAGEQIALAVDSAATSFAMPQEEGQYVMKWSGGGVKDREGMMSVYERLLDEFPIVLWEDPFGEHDWEGFRLFTERFGDRIEVVGDDNFVTNVQFIERGIAEKTANAALIKLNQIGTVTETIAAVKKCRQAGWRYFLSHRSGETEDTFLADFTVAMDGGHLKSGSACRSERIAKYNRLLEIERQLGKDGSYYWG
ncbi:Enolase [Poriferisphaera corsica]|uniref:Enolase n=1 Tax=Poriferisphaera corsica TaxID=2528020 RepID=A0A517YX88_9BACT|nr:phosphopyruvate hydratase [Poriferisphaera corsica]QDU34842.1 Enolase [Poriferisphaera corsica]